MTTIEVACPCGWRRAVSAELMGKRVRCRDCSRPVAVELQVEVPDEPALEPVKPRPARSGRRGIGRAARPAAKARSGTGRAARPAAKARSGGGWFKGLGGTLLLVTVAVGARSAARAARHAQEHGTVAVAATAAWGTHTSSGGRFSVDLPEAPRSTTELSDGVPVHQLRLETSRGRSLFQASSAAMRGVELDPEVAFTLLEASSLDGLSPAAAGPVSVTSRRTSTHAGHPARDLAVEFRSKDGATVRGRVRHVIVQDPRGDRLVEVLVCSAGAVSDEAMQHYLDSLRIAP